ncbi:hypothetical protein CTA2_11059 [Colletotrichum tanaceti]|uniref:Uncharacterized protein n=1 Tax=Colletotrichum tanaceti TaxID=1306861 RepID=A0A4U6XH83_9PEZI|nr:hypothetical protein CTA2_11059 [Colletotrichum tanaceti]TKW55155.1 hypothetical protein CTA1_11964 [Colletotrichum tanaceti]
MIEDSQVALAQNVDFLSGMPSWGSTPSTSSINVGARAGYHTGRALITRLQHQPLDHPSDGRGHSLHLAKRPEQRLLSRCGLATLWASGGTAVAAAFRLPESREPRLVDLPETTSTAESLQRLCTGSDGGGDSGGHYMLWWMWTALVHEGDDCYCPSLHLGALPVQGRQHWHHRAQFVGSMPLNLLRPRMYRVVAFIAM